MTLPPPSASAASRPRPFGLEGSLSLLATCLVGTVLSSSYNTMVNVALPEIGQVFGVDLTVVQWVLLSYLLVTSSTIVVSGRLGDLFGARRIYRLGLIVFGLGGLACALAPSLPVLLVARPLQALGASMYVVSVPSILTAAFPDHQRGRVIGLYSTSAYVGLSAGPVLGGLLTAWLGWRSVFLFAPVAGAVTAWLSWRYLPLTNGGASSRQFDLLGSFTYFTMLAASLLALSRAGQWGVRSPLVLGLLALGLVSLVVFLRAERRAEAPVVDLRLFAGRYFAFSALASVVQFIALHSAVFLMPFYLVQARDISPAVAGLILAAQPTCMVLCGPVVGVLSDRVGSTWPATLGAGLVGAALVLLAQVGPATPYAYLAVCMGVLGGGAALGNVANNAALMGGVPPSRRGMASGAIGTARYVGQSLGVALASAIFTLAVGSAVGPQSWAGFSTAFLAMSGVALIAAALSAARGRPPRFVEA